MPENVYRADSFYDLQDPAGRVMGAHCVKQQTRRTAWTDRLD